MIFAVVNSKELLNLLKGLKSVKLKVNYADIQTLHSTTLQVYDLKSGRLVGNIHAHAEDWGSVEIGSYNLRRLKKFLREQDSDYVYIHEGYIHKIDRFGLEFFAKNRALYMYLRR
jgi:hypothetical protein